MNFFYLKRVLLAQGLFLLALSLCFGSQILVLATEFTRTAGSYRWKAPWAPTMGWQRGFLQWVGSAILSRLLGLVNSIFWPMC